MKIRKISIAIASIISASAYSQEPLSIDIKDYKIILEQIPPQTQIRMYMDLINPSKATKTPYGIELELKTANEHLEKMKIAIPKLRNLIKIGTSIFDYPGLLSRGFISYSEYSSDGKYRMYIGAYFRSREGSGPYDFEILFNEKGIITNVKTVVWKH